MNQDLSNIQEKLKQVQAIQWPQFCPEPLVGVNVPLALEEGINLENATPDGPPQYNRYGQLCVDKSVLETNVSKRSRLVTSARELATSAAKMMRVAFQIQAMESTGKTKVKLDPAGELVSQVQSIKQIALAAARLAARAQHLDSANLSCTDINELFKSKEDRSLFCGMVNASQCTMDGERCVDMNQDDDDYEDDEDEDDDELL